MNYASYSFTRDATLRSNSLVSWSNRSDWGRVEELARANWQFRWRQRSTRRFGPWLDDSIGINWSGQRVVEKNTSTDCPLHIVLSNQQRACSKRASSSSCPLKVNGICDDRQKRSCLFAEAGIKVQLRRVVWQDVPVWQKSAKDRGKDSIRTMQSSNQPPSEFTNRLLGKAARCNFDSFPRSKQW